MSIRNLASWRSLGGVLAALALVLAACGGDSGSATGSTQIAPPDEQVLRLRIGGEPKTIDPHLSNLATEASLIKPLFSGLFTYDRDLKIVADLAAEMPTVDNGGISRDGLVYTIKLAKDAKWSDGKPVTADDLVFSLRRALDPRVASTFSGFFNAVAGARDYNTALGTRTNPKTVDDDELARLRGAVGVEAKDGATVVYRLTDPNPSFLNLLALWTAFPVRQDVVEKYGDRWTEPGNHVGNGPFLLREWQHDSRMVFTPNPFWHGEKPVLQRIAIEFIADDNAAWAAYLAGQLDAVAVPAANRREVLSPGSPLHDQLVRQPELTTFALIMNQAKPPFDNLKVRQAFGMAINRTAFVDGVLQSAGRPTTSWIPPGMPGYNESIGKQYELNAAKARQTLAEAGYADGKGLPKVSFLWSANDSNRLMAQFIEDQLRTNLGVEIENEFVDNATRGRLFTTSEFQATIISWTAQWAYPDFWLPEVLGSASPNNRTGFKSARFDELMRRAAAETDDKKRLAIYDEAHKLAIDEAALMPLYNRDTFIVVKPNVRNYVVTGLDGGIKGDFNLHRVFIAK